MRLKTILIILCLLLLSGCKAQTELNNIGIVMAVAIDKEQETNNVILTSQVIRPSALNQKTLSKESAVELISTKGSTIFEAIRKTTQEFDRLNYYAHTKIIVIDENLAKEGITPILDFFVRGRELRGYTWLCIAKNAPAREIIGVKIGIDTLQANYLKSIIENNKYHYKATAASVIDYYRNALGEGINPITGVLELTKSTNTVVEERPGTYAPQVKLSGTAVFKNDALVGYLNEEETQGLHWVIGKVKSGVITLPSLLQQEKPVSLEIKNSKTTITPDIKNEKVIFNINVNIDVHLVEEQAKVQITYPKVMLNYLDNVKKEAEKKN